MVILHSPVSTLHLLQTPPSLSDAVNPSVPTPIMSAQVNEDLIPLCIVPSMETINDGTIYINNQYDNCIHNSMHTNIGLTQYNNFLFFLFY